MDLFLGGIAFLAILLNLYFYYQKQCGCALNMLIVIAWMMLYGLIAKFTIWPLSLLLIVMSIGLWMFFQDWTTQYFCWRWLFASGLVLILISHCKVGLASRMTACGFCALFAGTVWLGWLGSADLIFLLFSGWLIGYERLLLLLWISSIMGLVMTVVSFRRCIPLISFLVFNMMWILTLTF